MDIVIYTTTATDALKPKEPVESVRHALQQRWENIKIWLKP
jgi:hypothetical protein